MLLLYSVEMKYPSFFLKEEMVASILNSFPYRTDNILVDFIFCYYSVGMQYFPHDFPISPKNFSNKFQHN